MSASQGFKDTLMAYLKECAKMDTLFAEAMKKPKKNLDDCVTYILNEVQKSGQMGFADDEIYNMAIHYYDEDEIDIGKPINAKVVVNHHVPKPPPAPKPTAPATPAKPKATASDQPKPKPMSSAKPVMKIVSAPVNQTSMF